MFWRLIIGFVAFAVLGATLVLALLSMHYGETLPQIALIQAWPWLLLVGSIAIIPGYLLGRRFISPLLELTEGAHRIADGEYGHRVASNVFGESRSLARAFNSMSKRLKKQFDQLESDRRQLRTILGGMIEGVIAVDAQQKILFANETAGKLLSFHPDLSVGRPFWEVTRQPQIQELVQKTVRGTEPTRLELDWKGPHPHNLLIYVAPFMGESETGAILVVHDVTELRRLERMRQDFVANVSHELKTPLSVIKACEEALRDGAVEDPEARKPFLEQIADQADRLYALILDLLSLARIESGEEMLDFQKVSIDQAVSECLERHRPRADAKNQTLSMVAPEGPELFIWVDEEALSQILDNLVDNAVKYTPNGGSIHIRWQPNGLMLMLQVEDTGNGIPERDLPRVFERFYRVDRARSREVGGTGLGLAIVKHLVQVMKGTVKVTSQVGTGTTFTVHLPLAS